MGLRARACAVAMSFTAMLMDKWLCRSDDVVWFMFQKSDRKGLRVGQISSTIIVIDLNSL